ncbi:hypothetical protein GCM10011611_35250 [Aliidongia dinghuensis]|uniref:YxiG-like domain-containing protein n=1 Tax=Aliidongia dinghuensis TaxID=1867774 RepID=A0A8J3E306_9PROT|nr:hypothetical protein [Aliidongia dinghuensis]GGF26144.1 hypothetical protein GCM10011611_35250 [Aliidongia dinghuensis]
MAEHPLRQPMREWLPEFDFGVLHHGFAQHGRDYVLILQAMGIYELTLTHVVEHRYQTAVRDDLWSVSWDDSFTDGDAWQAAGMPDGFVWGANSFAYPGIEAPDNDPLAVQWSARLGKPMFAMTLETGCFRMSIIFHSARVRKLSDDASAIRAVLNPLPAERI